MPGREVPLGNGGAHRSMRSSIRRCRSRNERNPNMSTAAIVVIVVVALIVIFLIAMAARRRSRERELEERRTVASAHREEASSRHLTAEKESAAAEEQAARARREAAEAEERAQAAERERATATAHEEHAERLDPDVDTSTDGPKPARDQRPPQPLGARNVDRHHSDHHRPRPARDLPVPSDRLGIVGAASEAASCGFVSVRLTKAQLAALGAEPARGRPIKCRAWLRRANDRAADADRRARLDRRRPRQGRRTRGREPLRRDPDLQPEPEDVAADQLQPRRLRRLPRGDRSVSDRLGDDPRGLPDQLRQRTARSRRSRSPRSPTLSASATGSAPTASSCTREPARASRWGRR